MHPESFTTKYSWQISARFRTETFFVREFCGWRSDFRFEVLSLCFVEIVAYYFDIEQSVFCKHFFLNKHTVIEY